MTEDLKPYNLMSEEELKNLPEDKLYEIALSALRYCNHNIKSTSENIKASLAKMDALDQMQDLYNSLRRSSKKE